MGHIFQLKDEGPSKCSGAPCGCRWASPTKCSIPTLLRQYRNTYQAYQNWESYNDRSLVLDHSESMTLWPVSPAPKIYSKMGRFTCWEWNSWSQWMVEQDLICRVIRNKLLLFLQAPEEAGKKAARGSLQSWEDLRRRLQEIQKEKEAGTKRWQMNLEKVPCKVWIIMKKMPYEERLISLIFDYDYIQQQAFRAALQICDLCDSLKEQREEKTRWLK